MVLTDCLEYVRREKDNDGTSTTTTANYLPESHLLGLVPADLEKKIRVIEEKVFAMFLDSLYFSYDHY